MNNLQKKARPAQKHLVTNQEPNSSDTQNGLNKVEGILTSPIKLKGTREGPSYFWAFFQLEGIPETDIPVIFRIKKNPFISLSGISISGYEKQEIPPRAKILLTGEWAEPINSPVLLSLAPTTKY